MNETINEKRIKPKYKGYANLLKAKQFEFKTYEHPFDVYTDGQNEIRICEGCHILRINGQRIPTMYILKNLVEYLFGKEA